MPANKYHRLVAFGCSITYGHGLEDCYDSETGHCLPTPSRYSWPSVLGKQLDIPEICNYGILGASNKLIWKTVLDTELTSKDLVIIAWSFIDRYCIFNRNQEPTNFGAWHDSELANIYYKHIHSREDRIIDDNLRLDHANLILRNKGITCYNAILKRYHRSLPWCSARILKTDIQDYDNQYPKAEDNIHPGPMAQQIFATDMYNEIIGEIYE